MREFKARIREINGKKVLVIKAQTEEIIHPDGRKDIIVHVPSLGLMSGFVKEVENGKNL